MLCYTNRAVYSSAGLQRCLTTDHYTFMFASQLTHKLPINRNQKRRTLRAKIWTNIKVKHKWPSQLPDDNHSNAQDANIRTRSIQSRRISDDVVLCGFQQKSRFCGTNDPQSATSQRLHLVRLSPSNGYQAARCRIRLKTSRLHK